MIDRVVNVNQYHKAKIFLRTKHTEDIDTPLRVASQSDVTVFRASFRM